MSYLLKKEKNLEFFLFHNLNPKNLIYGFTTKIWSLKEIIRNFNLEENSVITLRQIHSNKSHIITNKPKKLLVGDALITQKKGLLLTIRTADCLPILFYENEKNIIGAIHSGWKGTLKRITFKVLKETINLFNLNPSSLIIFLGPCICKKCYEVGEDVKRAFEIQKEWKNLNFLTYSNENKKYKLNLRKANLIQIYEAGIRYENIFSIDLCTKCNPDLFYSHRRNPKSRGRMLAFIGLKNY
ncbi:peptidoglycan editing factor PgeF [Candidatus Aminicenantes bacterium AC-335-A11]|jgi:hypothetical protein|nr:peptidoglycan editing factor PgeF [SCandidatus Aminicenantes bacterium Aminicenantia_JdfR_composite]MCP2598422.1 peptidoglycan editing factor PgeF [Candidatus Aminicenantes bacterium AC-335-L06]MCP2618438.1 peptidoglycan editing factor PgeF [Candidatus Aminicenantes bacterium AC-335-A11]